MKRCATWMLAALTVAVGCGNGNEGKGRGGGDDVQEIDQSVANDAQVLGVLMALNAGEIAQANFALTHAQAATVSAFAQNELNVHSTQQTQLELFSASSGIQPEASPVSDLVQSSSGCFLDQLNVEPTLSFDARYMRVQVDMHQQTIGIIDTRLTGVSQNAELAQLVQQARDEAVASVDDANALVTSICNAGVATIGGAEACSNLGVLTNAPNTSSGTVGTTGTAGEFHPAQFNPPVAGSCSLLQPVTASTAATE